MRQAWACGCFVCLIFLTVHDAFAVQYDDSARMIAPALSLDDASSEQSEPNSAAEPLDPNDPYTSLYNLKEKLRKATGTTLSLSGDLVDHEIVSGPSPGWNRGVARYDFGVNQLLWSGALIDMDVRGGTGNGVDLIVPNFANTDQYAETFTPIFILHLYIQQKLFDDQLTLRAGKFDIGDWVDTNRFGYYNFIGYSFAHNYTIPLPENTTGAMFMFDPSWAKWFYLYGGISDSRQNPRTAGFKQTFDEHAQFFNIYEIGIKPKFFGLNGVYRFDGWFDPKSETSIDRSFVERNRAGFALSFDQNITRHFGIFFRYGYTDQNAFNPQQNMSYGFNWFGPIPGRTHDVLAAGVVNNIFGHQRSLVTRDASDYEWYVETYYQLQLTKWLFLQPAVQVVTNPNGQNRSTETQLVMHVGFRF